jgi:hypothetical protein
MRGPAALYYFRIVVRFWTAVHTGGERVEHLCEGLIATSRIILLGIAIDMILPVPGVHYVLCGGRTAHRLAACFRSLPADPRPGHAHRALAARRRFGRNPASEPASIAAILDRVCRNVAVREGSS